MKQIWKNMTTYSGAVISLCNLVTVRFLSINSSSKWWAFRSSCFNNKWSLGQQKCLDSSSIWMYLKHCGIPVKSVSQTKVHILYSQGDWLLLEAFLASFMHQADDEHEAAGAIKFTLPCASSLNGLWQYCTKASQPSETLVTKQNPTMRHCHAMRRYWDILSFWRRRLCFVVWALFFLFTIGIFTICLYHFPQSGIVTKDVENNLWLNVREKV